MQEHFAQVVVEQVSEQAKVGHERGRVCVGRPLPPTTTLAIIVVELLRLPRRRRRRRESVDIVEDGVDARELGTIADQQAEQVARQRRRFASVAFFVSILMLLMMMMIMMLKLHGCESAVQLWAVELLVPDLVLVHATVCAQPLPCQVEARSALLSLAD